jgi:hypothetical protein
VWQQAERWQVRLPTPTRARDSVLCGLQHAPCRRTTGPRRPGHRARRTRGCRPLRPRLLLLPVMASLRRPRAAPPAAACTSQPAWSARPSSPRRCAAAPQSHAAGWKGHTTVASGMLMEDTDAHMHTHSRSSTCVRQAMLCMQAALPSSTARPTHLCRLQRCVAGSKQPLELAHAALRQRQLLLGTACRTANTQCCPHTGARVSAA